MAASDFFRDVGTSIFKPVGDLVGGAVTALQPGRVQQMRQFAESQRIQDLLRQAQTDALRGQPTTKTQELMGEGYTPEEARKARDISLGFEPRASSRLTYEDMSDVEKLKYLTAEKLKAEGQYYGLPSSLGNIEPRDPKLLDWTLRELNKLPQYRQQEGTKLDNRDYFISDFNIPKTFEQLGITDANDQVQIQELDKALPDMDVRADIPRDPQFYQNLLKALRDKEIDIKKAIEIIKSEKTPSATKEEPAAKTPPTAEEKIDISDIPEPKTKSEFINMLRRLKERDEPKSRKYYNEYLDKFW